MSWEEDPPPLFTYSLLFLLHPLPSRPIAFLLFSLHPPISMGRPPCHQHHTNSSPIHRHLLYPLLSHCFSSFLLFTSADCEKFTSFRDNRTPGPHTGSNAVVGNERPGPHNESSSCAQAVSTCPPCHSESTRLTTRAVGTAQGMDLHTQPR